TLAAHDLGYVTTDALATRIDRTLTTLEGLERHEGHVLNWYDTATLTPLHPRYVSTVDSGNLAASLIALAQGLLELDKRPQTVMQRLDGLADAASLLAAASRSTESAGLPHEAMAEINRSARAVVTAIRGGTETGDQTAVIGALVEPFRALSEAAASNPDLAYWLRSVVDQADRLHDDRT